MFFEMASYAIKTWLMHMSPLHSKNNNNSNKKNNNTTNQENMS